MVLAVSHRISPVPWYSGIQPKHFVLRLQGHHLLWRRFPGSFNFNEMLHMAGPTTPNRPEPIRFGLFPVRSPLLRESLLFSFPPANEMFQFTGLAFRLTGILHLQCNGFPHSEICGSRVICTSPQLIAAYRVLHRL